MKTRRSHIVFSIHLIVAVFLFTSFTTQEAKALPSKSDIVSKMILVNDYWITENPNSGDNKWARSVYFIGNMAMYDVYPDSKYYEYAEDWAIRWDWKLNGSIWYPHADNQAAGQTYIALYKYDPQPYKIEHIQTSVNIMVNRATVTDWSWVDAMFMAMPNFVELGNINLDTTPHDKMWDLFAWTKYSEGGEGLYSDNGNNAENDFLWWRDKNQMPPNLTSSGKNVYWSRGNGWVIAAMVKVLKELPVSDSHYEEYKQTLISMAGSLKDRQRSDGFWNVNLDDPNHYGGKETSGTAFFTYALAYGINAGILEDATYRPIVEKAWNGMVNDAIKDCGFLGYIQGPGHRPESSQLVTENSTNDFGVGAFLLAGTEVVKMAPGLMPDPGNPPLSSCPPPSSELSVTLSINTSSMGEATGTADLTVTLSEASELPVMVDFIYTGTATAGVDYSKPDVITIPAGNTFAQATLTAIDDSLNEGNETIIITLNNPINATLGAIITDTITITDDDNSGVALSVISQSAEQAGNEAIKVIDGNTSNDFRWSANGFPQWVIIDMGATPDPYDTINLWTYQSRAYRYIVWASDDLSLVQNEDNSVLVIDRSTNTSSTQPISDTTSGYPWRYVKLKVVGASGYGGNWVSINEIEMVQTSSPPSVTLSINTPSLGEAAGTADLTVTLSKTSELPVTVDLIYTGTATAGVDYSKSDVITIPAGNTFAQATLTAIDDSLNEGNETIIVTLSNPANATLGAVIIDTITIIDDDNPGVASSVISQSAEQAGNEAVKVIDGNISNDFRWSASGFPQWVIIDYGENKSIEGTELWTYQNRAYQYYVYASTNLADVENEVVGSLIVDHSNNTSTSQPISSSFTTLEARYVKLKIVGASGYSGSWSSINEFKIVEGDSTGLNAAALSLDFGIKQLQFSWPAVQNATYYRLMENPDGVSGFTQRGADITTTSHTLDIAVHRQNWGNARYLLQACNSNLCSDSNEVSTLGAMLSAIGYVKASNTQGSIEFFGGGVFGLSVALSGDGNTLAVGTTEEFSSDTGVSNGGTGGVDDWAVASGAVYVFSRNGGSWSQQAYIKASNTGALDFFGDSVALSNDGNTLAVGASQESSGATGISTDGTGEGDNSVGGAGAVYVFSRNGGSWSQQAYVKASNPGGFDRFGLSVALSDDGNTLAVGAHQESSNAIGISTDGTGEGDNSASDAGAVYVFSRDSDSWSQQAYIKASNAETSDYFGESVDLSGDGNTLAVGAWWESSSATGISTDGTGEGDNSAPDAGAVYVFSRAGDSWSQQAYIKASNTEAGDFFGESMDLSSDGNTLAVGARWEDSNVTGISSDGGGEENNSATQAGAVYVFSRGGGSWFQQAYVKASNTEANDWFGVSVALSEDGNALVVGALREDSNAIGISTDGTGEGDNSASSAGAVYVFGRNGGNWFQQSYVKASNAEEFDGFGISVSVSSDGNTLAVGALWEDSNAIGVTHGADAAGANNSATGAGAVYLY